MGGRDTRLCDIPNRRTRLLKRAWEFTALRYEWPMMCFVIRKVGSVDAVGIVGGKRGVWGLVESCVKSSVLDTF